MPRAKRIDQTQLVALLQQEIAQGDGWSGSDLAALRATALGYYFGELPPAEGAGRSLAVSTDVADMVEAVVAQLLPGFSGDNVVEFEPERDEDVEQAQTESDIVNDVVLEQNRGYVGFQEALRDALLLRNGWMRCWKDEVETVSQRIIQGEVDPAALTAGIAQLEAEPDVTMVEVDDDDDGITRISITRKRDRMRVAAVDPCSMVWESDWDSVFLEGIRFLAERSYPTQSDLLDRGYDAKKVRMATGFVTEPTPSDLNARYDRPGGAPRQPDSQPSNLPEAVRIVELWTCYYTYDSDGDGIAELHRVLLAGGSQILEDEQVDFIPYATGTPFLQPHQLNGLGLFDKLRSVQDIKTATLRKWINNLEACNNARVGVNEKTVNMDDVVNGRPGGVVRFRGQPGMEMAPFPIVDTGQSALALLGYADKMRSERGGASLDLQSAEAQIAGHTAAGTERQYSSREQLAAMACRTLAETLVRTTYAMVHRGLRTWFDEEVSARVRGEFVKSNPVEWPERFRINVKSGLSIAERSQKKLALEQVLMQQEKMLTLGMGGQLTDLTQVYHAQLDWTRAAALDNGERYFINPDSEPAQQAARQKAQAQQQQTQAMEALQQQVASSAMQVEGMKAAIDKYQTDIEAGFKYFDAVLKAQVEAMKSQQQPTAEVDALSTQGVITSESSRTSAAAAGNGVDAGTAGRAAAGPVQ